MPTEKWKVADLAKIRKMRSNAQGKKANDKLKALKKSASDAKKIHERTRQPDQAGRRFLTAFAGGMG